ncbi:hypothetical protein BFV93_0179 [Alteromonas macleodii]|nr:hypothetical protein BFV93_0179 [Alteromonas macleodii]
MFAFLYRLLLVVFNLHFLATYKKGWYYTSPLYHQFKAA